MRQSAISRINGGLDGGAERLAGSLLAGTVNPVQFTTRKFHSFGGDYPKLTRKSLL